MAKISPAITLRRLARCFLAGLLALLPVVITVAVILWVADVARRVVGPGTLVGRAIRSLGLAFASDDTIAYAIGIVVVVAAIFAVGVAVESGARNLIQRLLDIVLRRIPLVGSLYSTSQQVVGMLDRKDDSALKGMRVVFCHFGRENGAGVLALLVSPECCRINGCDYQIILVPMAPVPIGGGLLFVPAEVVQPTDISVEGLMSIYVSMGITAGQFLEPASRQQGDLMRTTPAAENDRAEQSGPSKPPACGVRQAASGPGQEPL